MTAQEELQTIDEYIDKMAAHLPAAEALGGDTTRLRMLLERLRRETQKCRDCLS